MPKAALATLHGKSTMPQRGAGSRKDPVEERQPRLRTIRSRRSVATAPSAAAAQSYLDDEHEEPGPIEEEVHEERWEVRESNMTEEDWDELDFRALRDDTPEPYRVFPRDERAIELAP